MAKTSDNFVMPEELRDALERGDRNAAADVLKSGVCNVNAIDNAWVSFGSYLQFVRKK